MIILLLVVGLILGCCPYGLRYLRGQKRDRLLALQLRQSLQSMVHALQVGTSFLQALERAADEGEAPLAKEFQTVIHSVRMGASLPEALSSLGVRVPLKEMKWFITAGVITQQTGGSLSGVLETLANTLQERETLREKVAALTAQGKVSGVLLSILPFVMMGALSFIAPEMIKPLFVTAVGQMMLAAVIGSVTIGGWVIFKIVSIKAD